MMADGPYIRVKLDKSLPVVKESQDLNQTITTTEGPQKSTWNCRTQVQDMWRWLKLRVLRERQSESDRKSEREKERAEEESVRRTLEELELQRELNLQQHQ